MEDLYDPENLYPFKPQIIHKKINRSSGGKFERDLKNH